TVDLLLKENANVVGCDLQTDRLLEYEHNRHFTAFQGDLINEKTAKEMFQKTKDTFGSIDGLANIAGMAQSATTIEEVSLDEWHKIMDINMTIMYLTCRQSSIYMKEEEKGSIVNVGSVSVTRPRSSLQSYVASKGSVDAFSKASALDLAP